jgi:hypothetical protein
MTWKDVLPEEAARNRLYGFSGWLLAAYVAGVATFLAWLGLSIYSFALGIDGRSTLGIVRTTIGSLAALQALFIVPFLVLAPLRHHAMPSVVMVCVWFGVAVNMLHSTAPLAALYIVWAAVFTVYLLRSRRVNVTYLHRVPVA